MLFTWKKYKGKTDMNPLERKIIDSTNPDGFFLPCFFFLSKQETSWKRLHKRLREQKQGESQKGILTRILLKAEPSSEAFNERINNRKPRDIPQLEFNSSALFGLASSGNSNIQTERVVHSARLYFILSVTLCTR